MTTAAERVEEMSKGFLKKEMYVIISTVAVPRDKIVEVLPEHLEHQMRLEKQGIMFAAGPMFKEDGTGGRGLIVVRADSFEAAKAIAESDPFHKRGLRTFTLERWEINEGRYMLQVDYSDQSVKVL